MTIRLARHYADAALVVRSGDDGHTVEGIAVPYDQPVDVTDEHGTYREVFTRASFAGWLPGLHRARAEHRIGLNLDHSSAFDHRIGFARAVTDTDHGLAVTFRLYDDPARLDKIRDMLATSHNGLSIEADVTRYRERAGVREWLGGRLRAVAATASPVHPDARILAVRALADDADPVPLGTPRLDAAIARWGGGAVPSRPV